MRPCRWTGSRWCGLYGAKITGGGSGGTIAVLGERGVEVREVVEEYEVRTGRRAVVFDGSSEGVVGKAGA